MTGARLVDLFVLSEDGVHLIDSVTFNEWCSFITSPSDIWVVTDENGDTAYSQDSITALVADQD